MKLVTLSTERWIAQKLFADPTDRENGFEQRAMVRGTAVIFAGDTTAAIRRERIRKEILGRGIGEHIAGRVKGRGETWAQLFARVYGGRLELAGESQELPLA